MMAEGAEQEATAAVGSLQRLKQRSHKYFPLPIQPRLVCLNPTLELVAVATTEKQLDVFRFGGQRAYGIRAPRDKPSMAALCWSFEGLTLAVWWDDNTWQTIDSRTGAVAPIQTLYCDDFSPVAKFDVVAWEPKIINPHTRVRIAGSIPDLKSIEDSISRGKNDGEHAYEPTLEDLLTPDVAADFPEVTALPTLLASFTVRDELPRLSSLPVISTHGLNNPRIEHISTLLSRQESVDRTLNFTDSGDADMVDLLILGHGEGHITIGQGYRKYGLCCLTVPDPTLRDVKLVGYASHPSACCQAFLTSAIQKDESAYGTQLGFGIFFSSLNIIRQSSHYLPVVIQAVSQIRYIIVYIQTSILAIREAWSSARDVFSRFMDSIEATLSSADGVANQDVDIITALYRLVVTGRCGPAVEEWLRDIMGLQGIERWSAELPNGLVNVIDLIHGNLLPALDRCTIETSRLRAMSRNTKAPICRLREETLTQLINDLDILRVLSNAALLYAREEIPQVEVFATFLRCQLQVLREPDSSTARDAVETIAGLDYALLLSFITGPMTKSHLNVFFGRDVATILKATRRPKQQAGKKIILSMLDRHSQNPMPGRSPVVEFVNMFYQTWFLSDTGDEMDAQMREEITKGSIHAHFIHLDWGEMSDAKDIRMIFTKAPADEKFGESASDLDFRDMATYIVAVPEASRNELRLHRKFHKPTLYETDLSPSQVRDSQKVFCDHGICKFPNCSIWDVKFVNDATLVLLLSDMDNNHFLVQFPAMRFRESGSSKSGPVPADLPPHTFTGEAPRDAAWCPAVQVNFSDIKPYIIHEFDSSGSPDAWVPRHMHIRGPGRAAKHILLLDETATRYTVFDLGGVNWRWS